uniref:Lactamase_B domain-containing protein n=1 Tax=Meloidogyne hapla TaxID=6305 RepID=A0A1I8BYQ1_MELHA
MRNAWGIWECEKYETAILIADRHTMPLLDGRTKMLREHLPPTLLLEGNIYDINLRDFAPMGCLKQIKFIYRNAEWAPIASKQVDDSMNRFLMKNRIKLQRREPEVFLSGRDVVDNGKNRALISNVVIVPSPTSFTGRKNLRLDDVLAFADDGLLIISGMDPVTKLRTISELYKREKKDVAVLELPIGDEEKYANDQYLRDEGNCGLYTTMLGTERYLFVPVFGNNPANWKRGYSTKTDKMVLRLIETNTRKRVIPVNIPREICRRGISLRSLAWILRGSAANQIRGLARGKEN